jgi:signal transduction histidine kinase
MSPGTRGKPAPIDVGNLTVRFNRGIRRLVVAFLIAVTALPLISIWGTYRAKTLSAQIVAVEECRLLVSRALRYAIDEETGVRGYLESREPLFLQPQRAAHPALLSLLAILPARFKEAGFDSALPELKDFAGQHAAWYATVAQPLLDNPARTDRVALQESGKRFMDQMRMDSMSIHMKGAVLAQQAARQTSQVITASVVVSALWIFIVAAFTVLLQRRSVRHQMRLINSLVHEREEVERLSDWRARLLAMLAHDFKSQLTVLIGATHLLEDFPQRRSDAELLASLRNASYSLAEMADNAILLARAQERKIQLHRTAFDITPLLDSVVQRYENEREFHVHRASPSAMVQADRSYVARVLDNIIGNAVKYSDQPVHVYLQDLDDFVRVSVVDRGIGISPNELPHIFEEYWRSERATWKRGGSGVGLFIVKTIMEAHGGTIEVQSETGEGTTVSLNFPRALSSFAATQAPLPV